MKLLSSLSEQFWSIVDVAIFIIAKSYTKKMFLAGESINEGLATAARLRDKQYGVTYNIMAEDLTDVRTVQSNVRTNIELALRAQERGLAGNIAVKLSAFGGALPATGNILQNGSELFFNEREAKRYLSWLLHEVANIPDMEIEVDAEEYHTLPGTYRVIQELSKKYPGRLRMAVQMHVPNLSELAKEYAYSRRKIRIVRGAGVYQDAISTQKISQEETDKQAFKLIERSIKAGQVPYLGTLTNTTLLDHTLDFLDERKLPFRLVVLESLYGPIGRTLRRYALGKGVHVVVYTPIVVEWCLDAWEPYCKRRISMMRKYFWKLLVDRANKIIT